MSFYSRARNWLALLPLIGLLGATYWLNLQVQPGPPRADSSKRHDPDAIIENFSATNLNEQGSPSFILAANKLQHYPDDDSTTLEEPRITILSAENPAIHATAKYGTISSRGDEIFLRDDIRVNRDASARQDELTLKTEYLHIIPDRNLTETDRAVTVSDAHNTIRAVGLEMNSKTRILKLLSQVRSDNVPSK